MKAIELIEKIHELQKAKEQVSIELNESLKRISIMKGLKSWELSTNTRVYK